MPTRRHSTRQWRAAAWRRWPPRCWPRTPTGRAAQTALQEQQARRNALAREIGQGKRTGADTAALEAEATALRTEMEGLEARAAALDAAIRGVLEVLPNILDPDVPDGADERANVVLEPERGAPRLRLPAADSTSNWGKHWG